MSEEAIQLSVVLTRNLQKHIRKHCFWDRLPWRRSTVRELLDRPRYAQCARQRTFWEKKLICLGKVGIWGAVFLGVIVFLLFSPVIVHHRETSTKLACCFTRWGAALRGSLITLWRSGRLGTTFETKESGKSKNKAQIHMGWSYFWRTRVQSTSRICFVHPHVTCMNLKYSESLYRGAKDRLTPAAPSENFSYC